MRPSYPCGRHACIRLLFFKRRDLVLRRNCKISFLISVSLPLCGAEGFMKNCNGFHIPHSVIIRIAFQSAVPAQKAINRTNITLFSLTEMMIKCRETNLATAVKMQF